MRSPAVPEARRDLRGALAELSELGFTDDDYRVYFLEVLADEDTWRAGGDDPRWRVAAALLTHDQPPFNRAGQQRGTPGDRESD